MCIDGWRFFDKSLYEDKHLGIYTVKNSLPKQKTTIVVDKKLWKDFLSFVVKKHGTTRKTSVEIESAIREYLNHHGKEV